MQVVVGMWTVIVLVSDRTSGRVRLGHDGQPVVEYRPGRAECRELREGVAAGSRVLLAAGAQSLLALNHRRLGLSPQGGAGLASPRAGRLQGGAGSPRAGRPQGDAAGLPAAALDAYFAQVARSRFHANWSTLFSAHQMGTCRMGRDPRGAVCDETGEVFGVGGLFVADASAFPASSGVNPMITIIALAHHTPQAIKARG